MLALVPQLSFDGFVHAAQAGDDSVVIFPEGSSWCRIDVPQAGRTLIAGRMHIRPTYTDLYLGLTGDETVVYDGLSFGFQWNETSGEWPPQGARYVQSDQKWLVAHRIFHHPGADVSLVVWAENGGDRVESSWVFAAPAPITRPEPGPDPEE